MAIFEFINRLTAGVPFGIGARRGFPKTLQASDFSTATTAVITTAFTKIGSYTVPAQQEIAVGFGNAREPDNEGYIYVVSKDSVNAAMEGMLRIMCANSEETRIVKVFEERTNVLSGSATLRTQKVAFPEILDYGALGRKPREDDKIQLWLKVDTAGTWSPTYSTVYIPVTIYA